MKKKKLTLIILSIAVLFMTVSGIYLSVVKKPAADRNNQEKEPVLAEEQKESPLYGKRIIFLGSSVTYGEAADGYSFVDYLEEKDGIKAVKEAVSGTTLTDSGGDSYVQRMKNNIDKDMEADAFVCQLSTNDATQRMPLGEIADTKELEDFDTGTVTGAIEYIIGYASETWDCPVIFYTNSKFGHKGYEEMIDVMTDIQKKWNIGFIDMYNDTEFNDISDEQKKEYMADYIHPTRQGYIQWWAPYIEDYLITYLAE
ncbi:hypothetical protein BRYFOR_06821 [Marvinbryantia formatexigens DSM 14469]|uniref:SGNH hydrolase-type esterase domain-containing protein n=1 Tax=Marvinbryantia formatexigens DSM 14469 TaxID=478749 RepID=C6LDX2_9FIRM|nr:SGNH/GDSL hydrolase family protein [Marvinbryantia formatexigens]EET61176.1 hypothetical protein BRYFOR_06821 [Marvinbryantia formatexigens DSM 14469]UWO23741.1 SGNH/GDSL hydrolase family protein [Marvinbryantia formatexigens DSM 14469]SDF68903.1 Lysophospholipase L1 [Marvinbryantia formatexigens]